MKPILKVKQLEEADRLLLRRKLSHLAGLTYLLLLFHASSLYGVWKVSLALTSFVLSASAFYTAYEILRVEGKPLRRLQRLWRLLGSPEGETVQEYWNACWFGLSITLTLLISLLLGDLSLTYIAGSAVILGDGFSGLTGYFLGKHRIAFNPSKTLEGAVAGFLAAFLGGFLFTGNPMLSLLGALAGSAVELYPSKLPDNLTITLTVTLILLLAKILGGIFP